MNTSALEKPKTATETAASIFVAIGAIGLLIASVDAYVAHFLPGENPLSLGDGHGSFRGVLRGLKQGLPDGASLSVGTPEQQITAVGSALTAFAFMYSSPRLGRVSGSWTLAALAAYEASLSMNLSHVANLMFYGGAASSMFGTGLSQLVSPSLLERIQRRRGK